MKMQIWIATILTVVFAQPCLAENESREVEGSISKVIVYRGQAMVTREITVDLPEGATELVVKELPERIVAESLFAQTTDDVTVSSVRYREKAVREDTREEVKQLEAQIEQLQSQRRHIIANQDLINQNRETLIKLENFTVAAQSSDLNRGVLQFDPLEKIVGHIETKRSEYHEASMKLGDQIRELDKQLELLQRKLNELRAGRSRTEREAVLIVNTLKKGKPVIELSYLVNNAGWLPQYNLRAQPDESKVVIEYNSVIHQASGEDWENVALSLSTAQPTMAATAPALEPIKVEVTETATSRWGFRARKAEAPESVGKLYEAKPAYRDLSGEFKKLQSQRLQTAQKGKAAQSALNVYALDNQMLELQVAEKEAVQVIKNEAKRFARTEGVSVTYNLGEGLTMPSRSDQQLITIAAFQAKADFIMMATPILTDYVYLQADIANGSDVILLAGPASMYRNGEFVGKDQIQMVTIGEKFTAGFGVDSQIQITREFEDKKVDSLWGDRVEEYEYRIAIENYKNTNLKLQLLDRIPYTEDEELEIDGFKTNTALSRDSEYLRTQKDKGILRWDLNLKPSTTEEKATIITYSYIMRYDNDLNIRPVPKAK
jgi:hypothetical protein